ncbi:hypothetical protein CFC21_088725 [Triticum aestivum]|uniref:Pectinesterase n=3 Tax=Triticum TaxID=4564 RepID=A0A9R1BC23_TRITD|nr:probable pectinesterase/pectinesterase inhibitor 32 [Triticum dicoccoides]XP_044409546.1 probable pectinesterase/pectinesterase inhibitor 32 [Triticum aestivum]KAF7085275.1 hypothetical protein CFC21_088725 [Triticum aestivum]VAI59064.1 unnamed protein product [Triticum turgidum subsp. durum]
MGSTVDVVVALDGSGNYRSISAAVAAAPRKSIVRHVVHIKAGVYNEYVSIGSDVWNITLVGDGMDRTIISGNRSRGGGVKTVDSGTVSVDGRGFVARDLSIENTAGAINHQAVALRSSSDNCAVYRCAITGYQDSLYAKEGKQFYRECRISGTVDFVFGDAAAIFQKCSIIARKPLKGQANVLTAQGRERADGPTGFAFLFCEVLVANDELLHADFAVETFLGRPWQPYSRVVFLKCSLQGFINPKWWLQWEGHTDVDKMFYGEYSNSGPGADVTGRVNWPGFHLLQDAEAANFSVEKFIQGDVWLPATGVEFTPGLGQ